MKKNLLFIISVVMMLGLITACNGGSGSGSEGTQSNVSSTTGSTEEALFDATGDWYITASYTTNASEETLDWPETTTICIDQETNNTFIAHIFDYDVEGTINGNQYTLSFSYITDDNQTIPVTLTLTLESGTLGIGTLESASDAHTFSYDLTAAKVDITEEMIFAD